MAVGDRLPTVVDGELPAPAGSEGVWSQFLAKDSCKLVYFVLTKMGNTYIVNPYAHAFVCWLDESDSETMSLNLVSSGLETFILQINRSPRAIPDVPLDQSLRVQYVPQTYKAWVSVDTQKQLLEFMDGNTILWDVVDRYVSRSTVYRS